MESFKIKVLEWSRLNCRLHALYMFAITCTLFLYTCYVVLYLPRISVIGTLAVVILTVASVYLFSSFKRFMTQDEAELAFDITKRTIFHGVAFMLVIPVSYIVSSEFTYQVGCVIAIILYLIVTLVSKKVAKNQVVLANFENLRNFDFLQGINVAEMTPEQQKEDAVAKKKAKAQMREDRKARKLVTEANMIEIPTIDNPNLDISPQFKESDS